MRAVDPRWIALAVLAVCLAVDLPLLLQNLLGERPFPRFWRLGLEWMAPAIAEYVKLGLTALVMLAAYRIRRLPLHGAWVAAFVILLVDDALQVHERAGRAINRLLPVNGQTVIAAAEAVVMLALAAVILAIVTWGYRATSDAAARRYSWQALVLLASLAFFAVGVDALHFLLSGDAGRLAGIIEDGGQLIVVSLVLAHAVWHLATIRSGSRPATER